MEDEALKRIRFEISTLVAANPLPMNAGRIAREYDEFYGQSLEVYQYGFMSLTAFLDDHPKLTAGIVEGQKCYRAGFSDNADAQEIQMLIKGQRKKKKNRGGKRGNFHRNSGFTRSERYQQKPQYLNYARASLREPYVGNRRPGSFYSPATRGSFGSTSTFSGLGRESPSFSQGFAKDSIFNRLTVPENSNSFTSQPRCAESCDPNVGVTRFMAALKDCDGRAPLYKLSAAYQKRFSTPLDGEELKKFFGTNNLKKIENTHLKDKVVVNALTGGRFIIASTQMLEEAREAVKKQAFTVIHKGEMKFDKPSLVTLKDHLVKILENIYPRQLPIDDIAVVYQRAHGVQVDPLSLFAKTWLELITGTLKGFFVLHSDMTVGLTDPFIRNLKQKRENSSPVTVLPKQNVALSAEQLGLAYESDSDEESDTESASQMDSLDASSLDSTLPSTCNSDRPVSSSATCSVKDTVPGVKETTPVCIPRNQVSFGFLRRPKKPPASDVIEQQNAIVVGLPSSNLAKVTEETSEFASADFTRSFAAPTTCLGRMSTVSGFPSHKQSNNVGDSALSSANVTKPATSVGKMMGVFKRFGISSSKRSTVNDVMSAPSLNTTDRAPKADDSIFSPLCDRFQSSYIVRYNGKKME